MLKVNFQDGTKVSSAKVTIDEVDYTVTPARYNGATPLSSTVMNTMQTNIENAINQNANNIGGEDYDNTETYEVGDIVKYEEQLYICIENVDTPEEFDDTKWSQTDVLSSAGGNEIAIGSQSDITGKTKIFVEESTQRLKYKDSTTGNFTDIAGDEVFIGDEQDAPESTKLLVDTEDDSWNNIGTEVVDTLEGNEGNRAPSVRAVNELNTYSTEEVRIGTWIDGKPIYRKVVEYTPSAIIGEAGKVTDIYIPHRISNFKQLCGQKCITSDGYILPTLGSKSGTTLDYGTCIRAVTTETINLRLVNDSFGIRTWYITLEYTKTTD